MDRVVVRFLIPTREDPCTGNGRLHPPFRWKLLQDALETTFGGWTRPHGELDGVWMDSHTRAPVQDTSRVFEVDVEEERLDEMHCLLRRAYHTFVQQCIRAEILGRAEYIEGGPDVEPL